MNMDGGRSIPPDAWSLKHGELPFVSHQVPHKSPLRLDATGATVVAPTVFAQLPRTPHVVADNRGLTVRPNEQLAASPSRQSRSLDGGGQVLWTQAGYSFSTDTRCCS